MDFTNCIKQISNIANTLQIERDFRANCLAYEGECSASSEQASQDYKEYINLYHRITSLYLIVQKGNSTMLIVHGTESEREEVKILKIPGLLIFLSGITLLPNGELFCYCRYPDCSCIALIIDRNYRVRTLPGETSCFYYHVFILRIVYIALE